ncbi:MAG: serine/threonine protein kinase [Planctomycetaceae bacterium]|nr:serine/threonine protein kinase [Planctomycetaceae bacterium]
MNEQPADSSHSDTTPLKTRDLSNSRVGEFLLLRRLGTGGMADVYLAEQTSLGRSVAIKILKDDVLNGSGSLSSSSTTRKRFEQEARTAAALNHPHIVQVYTTGHQDGLNYIVQEYVAGWNLSQWIRKHGSPDYGKGLKWMQEIASAIRAASEAGVVHRDIKPENIMITTNGICKVTDFGLAQLNAVPEKKVNLTQAGTTMGTPLYMSPEQIKGDSLDHRSDQYSFGVTCFHMFAGRPPFPGKNAVSVAVQHLKEEPPRLETLRADLPRKLCNAIHRMMAKDPAQRFQSQAELEAVLKALENVPVNTRLGSAYSVWSTIHAWLPPAGILIPGLVAAMLATYVAASQVMQPARLPEVDNSVPKESTAVRQFAVALLNPRDTTKWKAVLEYFPETEEAEFAAVRLGLLYVSRGAFSEAMETFDALQKQGLVPEKRHLRVLGLTGKAYALSKEMARKEAADNKADADKLREQRDELLDSIQPYGSDYPTDFDLELIFSQSPEELREFYGPLRARSPLFR